ncbi:ATPase H+ transporting accessory protein 1 like a [Pleuronectes platessa]|uniref:ATPase H+ transporting accessory protein 1 like a n=1 Tax=Pleuronectes platessa TaxID=8262 RepID=UPI00232A3DAB|nr:ATPase H+ transporting accessory protein 1 like a [Pleuronectes platessa]
MATPWKHCSILLLSLLLHLQSSTCLDRPPAHSLQRLHRGSYFRFEELLYPSLPSRIPHVAPVSPLQVFSDGEPCVLFQARRLSLRLEKQKQLDLTERAFSPQKSVDTSQSVCRRDKATLLMRFGDVEDLRGLSIRLQLSNTFYESSGQWWFSVDSVSLLYNTSEEAVFNASEVYAPASSSYHCLHVSNLQRHSALLLPSTDHARRWTITFTDFQIQAFNVSSGKFSPASDCATFLTPAILMGLVTSLILLLVLAYALHMVIHLKHIEHEDEHKADTYYPQTPEQPEHCYVENMAEKNIL